MEVSLETTLCILHKTFSNNYKTKLYLSPKLFLLINNRPSWKTEDFRNEYSEHASEACRQISEEKRHFEPDVGSAFSLHHCRRCWEENWKTFNESRYVVSYVLFLMLCFISYFRCITFLLCIVSLLKNARGLFV